MSARCFRRFPSRSLSSGAEFSKLIEPKRSIRAEALSQSPPVHGRDGTPYRIEYGVRASTSAPVIWIEESGCWFAGADGKPARVQGIVRINNERHARDEQLVEAGAARSPDRRAQPHPSDRLARRGDRGGHALPHVQRLHADRHRSFGAHQRCFRLRCGGRRDRGSRLPHPLQLARRRRARPLLRQQVRPDPEELHRRRHEHRRRAVSGHHPRRGGADQIRPGLGHRLDRRGQHAAPCAQRR